MGNLIDKAREATEQGRLAEARPLWQQVCEQDPINVDNWLVLSAIDEHLGFLPAALDHLKYPFQIEPNEPDIWLQAASLHWQLGAFDQALTHLFNALALDFSNQETRATAADWLTRLHRFDAALVHLRYLLLCSEENPTWLFSAFACAALSEHADFIDKVGDVYLADSAGLQTIVSGVAPLIIKFVAAKHVEKLDGINRSDSIAVRKFISALNLELERLDQQHNSDHLEFIAHTETAILTEGQQQQTREIAEITGQIMRNSDRVAPSLVEIGAGSGTLGVELSKHRLGYVITGVEFCTPAFKQLKKQSGYDTVLDWQRWTLHSDLILGSADCVLIRQRMNYHVPLIELLETVLNQIAPNVPVLIEGNWSGDMAAELGRLSPHLRVQVWPSRQSDQLVLISIEELNIAADCALEAPNQAEDLGNKLIYAQRLLEQGNYADADQIADDVLAVFESSAQALYIKGVYQQHLKNYPVSIAYLRKALAHASGYGDAWFQLATVWHALGRYKSMLRAYHQCLKYVPGHRIVLQNLAGFYAQQGQWGNVCSAMIQLLLNHPLDANVIEYVERLNIEIANPKVGQNLAAFQQSKEWLQAQFNNALERQYFVRAEGLLKQLESRCDEVEFKLTTLRLLDKSGDVMGAIEICRGLLEQDSGNISHLKTLRSLVLSTGHLQETHRIWLQSLPLFDARDSDIQGGLFASNYFDFCSDQEIADFHFRWAEKLSVSLDDDVSEFTKSTQLKFGTKSKQRNKLRIGYVSGDFKTHSVALFLYNIYKHCDRSQFEIVSYSSNPGQDAMTIKLRLFSDLWRDISKLNDAKAAKLIARDNIDILVDLSGHTGHNRLPLFAYRAAPIQCTYLGYANTSGMSEIDYRLTDAVADPVGQSALLHSEQLIRLPHGFLTYSRHFGSPPVASSSSKASHRHYTFVCCNNILKVNLRVVKVFAQILSKVAGSTLLIKAHNLNNQAIVSRYQQAFQDAGVDPSRVHLMNALDINDHQELYNHTDIALDPYPYSGTTTTCDALWMGVPVLTYAGSRHSSRVSASILTRIGMHEWIAESESDYIDKAVRFAADTQLLAQLRMSMRSRLLNSDLMHETAVCRDIESEYHTLWENYQKLLVSSA